MLLSASKIHIQLDWSSFSEEKTSLIMQVLPSAWKVEPSLLAYVKVKKIDILKNT